MSPNLTLLAVAACLYAAGVFLLLERSLTRVLLGVLLLGNATNLLLLSAGGPAGRAPFYGTAPAEEMSDPLVHALILTAIVITLGMAAFVLALIHRGWDLARRDDDIVDDAEDRRVAASASAPQDAGDDVHGEPDGDGGPDDDGDATDGRLPAPGARR